MTLDPNLLQIINGFTTSVLGKINRTISRKITTTFQDSDDVIPSSKLVKDEFATVRSEIPTKTSDLTNDGEDGSHIFIEEGDRRLTDSRNPNLHTQPASTITDTATYSNIGNLTTNQASINSAINDKIGALMNLDIIEQVTTRPTASENTLNKIYLVPEESENPEDAFKAYITIHKDDAYSWERIDIARIDLTDYIQKSETPGLVKNDGSIDTNSYATIASLNSLEQAFNSFTPKSLHEQDVSFLSNTKQDKTDDNLTTTDKTVVGAINSIKDSLDGKVDINQLSNYIQKSQTNGLIRNDGSIDTTNYLTESDSQESFNYGYLDSNLILHLIKIDGEISATETIIESGDETVITVLITDDNNVPLNNVPVELYINDVIVDEQFVTNSNGIINYTYEGIGVGEVKIQAKVGSFQSKTYSIFDCTFYDDGVTGNLPSLWVTGSATVNRDNTGTQFIMGENWANIYLDKEGTGSSSYDWTGNSIIEFTLLDISTSANIFLNIKDSSNKGLNGYNLSDKNLSENDIITVENNGSNIILKVNGVEKTRTSVPTNAYSIMFTSTPNSQFKFKDFKFYPI